MSTQTIGVQSAGPAASRWITATFAGWTLGIMALVQPLAVSGQSTQKLRGPSCSSCRVQAVKTVTLGSINGPRIVSEPNSVVRMKSGHYLVSHQDAGPVVSVFDSLGQNSRTLGRRGRGPGELQFARLIKVDAGDTIIVYDNAQRLLNRYTPGFTFHSSSALPGDAYDFELISGRRVVVNAILSARGAVSYPLHVISDSGQRLRSFGIDKPINHRFLTGVMRRNIVATSGDSIWASHFSAHILELWPPNLAAPKVWIRDVPWFKAHEGRNAINPRQSPPPVIVDMKIDKNGLVWLLIRVADSNWKQAVSARGQLQGVTRYGPNSWNEYYDTVIEVIDPTQGVVLVSQRFDTGFRMFVGEREAASYRETPDGAFIDLWRLSFTR